jgi:hypothetical protein
MAGRNSLQGKQQTLHHQEPEHLSTGPPEPPSWQEFLQWAKELESAGGIQETNHDNALFPAHHVARYKEAIIAHGNRRVLGIDIGTTHVGLAMAGAPCRRLFWACESLKEDLEQREKKKHKKFSAVNAPLYVTRLLKRLVDEAWHASPIDTWVVIECQPMQEMQLISACFKTWFHARGWPEQQVTMRNASAKLSFLGTSARYTAAEVERWMKIKTPRPANKLASVAAARTVLEDWKDEVGLFDIVRWAEEDKADDATDAFLFGCYEFWTWCVTQTYEALTDEYNRLQSNRRRSYYGMVTLGQSAAKRPKVGK